MGGREPGVGEHRGHEFLAARAEQVETTYRITIRHLDEIDLSWSLVAGRTIYAIEVILPGNQPVWLVYMCQTI